MTEPFQKWKVLPAPRSSGRLCTTDDRLKMGRSMSFT
jgi:hypothetical protein